MGSGAATNSHSETPRASPHDPISNMPGSQIRRKFAGHEEFSQPPQIYLNTLPCLEGKNPETFTRIGLCSEPWIWFAKNVKCEPTMFHLEKNCGRKKQGRRMTSNEHDSLFSPPLYVVVLRLVPLHVECKPNPPHRMGERLRRPRGQMLKGTPSFNNLDF